MEIGKKSHQLLPIGRPHRVLEELIKNGDICLEKYAHAHKSLGVFRSSAVKCDRIIFER